MATGRPEVLLLRLIEAPLPRLSLLGGGRGAAQGGCRRRPGHDHVNVETDQVIRQATQFGHISVSVLNRVGLLDSCGKALRCRLQTHHGPSLATEPGRYDTEVAIIRHEEEAHAQADESRRGFARSRGRAFRSLSGSVPRVAAEPDHEPPPPRATPAHFATRHT